LAAGNCPLRWETSGRFTPAACTFTNTSSAPQAGFGLSANLQHFGAARPGDYDGFHVFHQVNITTLTVFWRSSALFVTGFSCRRRLRRCYKKIIKPKKISEESLHFFNLCCKTMDFLFHIPKKSI
jgi:hypothetical protein